MTTQLLNNLNLARKWRPQAFDQVIGQDISVRMLKNGLYLNKFFPVYLFAGQRGCGKTTTARIFAAAINCAQLPAFQQNPTEQSIPCLTCSSCKTMINGNHADFIEIDAASHTGVDNVRQIIESSSYMPLIGQKKIYLIDEAHMLSKAAFNAFLKILEEPPASVTFILATTEVPKIPATVLSRCFQLIFSPINSQALKKHLQQICANEGVIIDDSALDLILNETEGSARDAINLLERVRFSSDQISEKTVLQVLGKISGQELMQLFEFLIEQEPEKMLAHLQVIEFEQRSAQLLWDMIVHLCRQLIWCKYGIKNPSGALFIAPELLNTLAQKCSLNRLNAILNLLWHHEELFIKTNKKHIFLEMVLLQLCQQVNVVDLEELIKTCQLQTSSTASLPVPVQEYKQVETQNIPEQPKPQPIPEPTNEPWALFLAQIARLNDLLLHSILTQASFVTLDEATKQITIKLNTNSAFFKNKIEETKPLWLPLMTEIFGNYTGFAFTYQPEKPVVPAAPPPLPVIKTPEPVKAPYPSRSDEYLIIKDPLAWPKASLLLKHFPGKIKKLWKNN